MFFNRNTLWIIVVRVLFANITEALQPFMTGWNRTAWMPILQSVPYIILIQEAVFFFLFLFNARNRPGCSRNILSHRTSHSSFKYHISIIFCHRDSHIWSYYPPTGIVGFKRVLMQRSLYMIIRYDNRLLQHKYGSSLEDDTHILCKELMKAYENTAICSYRWLNTVL